MSDKPPCPKCGEPYSRFVRHSSGNGGFTFLNDETFERACSSGLGVYVHD